jgi:murein DD-endopeptidase MepM/ murein hydrolase activator NlpD
MRVAIRLIIHALAAYVSVNICINQPSLAGTVDLGRNLDTCQSGEPIADYVVLLSPQAGNLVHDLVKAGLPQKVARRAMSDLLRAAKVQSGREPMRLSVARSSDSCGRGKSEIVALSLSVEGGQPITVAKRGNGPFQLVSPAEISTRPVRVTGNISGRDLGTALQEGGVPYALTAELANSFAADGQLIVAAQKDIRFDVLYQVSEAPGGVAVDATLTVASLISDGREHRIYFYRTRSGEKLPIDGDGNMVGVGPEFIHPLPVGKLTSPFGWRRHPVLHVRKFHNGIDFSAPRGTPVVAAADGKITMADKHKNYGRLIRIAHDDRIVTTYAHLDGFAPYIKHGATVRQGQVIGYVGHSGLASGNHLYFEMLVDGHCVDPMDMAPELAATEADAPREEIVKFVQLADALRASMPNDEPPH